eukprot:scaffold137623_cov56-Cyclotella_meneghiniana.AAC.1
MDYLRESNKNPTTPGRILNPCRSVPELHEILTNWQDFKITGIVFRIPYQNQALHRCTQTGCRLDSGQFSWGSYGGRENENGKVIMQNNGARGSRVSKVKNELLLSANVQDANINISCLWICMFFGTT